MKKTIALIFAVVMLLCVLTACGEQNAPAPAAEAPAVEEPAAEEPAAEEPAAEEPAVEEPAAEEPAAEPVYNEHKFVVAHYNGENSIYGQRIQKFADYVSEATDGKISFDIYYGGNFCSNAEELDYVIDGAIDIGFCSANTLSKRIPYFGIGQCSLDSAGCVELERFLMSENAETAALFDELAASLGFKVSTGCSTGFTGYVSKNEFTGWSDLSQHVFGCPLVSNVHNALGLNSQIIPIADIYESLSRGVIDATSGGFSTMMQRQYYEEASYLLWCEFAMTNNFMTVNINTWNGLTPDEQALLLEANEYAVDWTSTEVEAQYAASYDIVEATGCKVGTFSSEDAMAYITNYLNENYKSYSAAAADLGITDGLNAYCDAIEEYTGWTIERG